jgi:glycerol-3-phosphate acyltransferase PlsX
MKIIVDAFGGDNAPLEIIKGCAQAVAEQENLEIILVGSKRVIDKVANDNNIILYHIKVHDAPDIITMEDEPSEIMKSKHQSSMAEGLRLLHEDQGQAFISAGNSGALVVGATLVVKRIKGIKRCAFAPIIPTDKGCFMLIDSGANVECRPEMLQQFGFMGSVYMEKVMKIKKPRVALANVGVEDHKGGPFQIEAFGRLKESPINFIGNIEAREIPYGAADVIVTDGFTGNIILKLYEGVAGYLMGKIKDILIKNAKNKIASAMILPDMKKLKQELDYNEYGGAPILGISRPVFKAHGSAVAKTFKNAIGLTLKYLKTNAIKEIESAVQKTE